jgi:hypothetical protein
MWKTMMTTDPFSLAPFSFLNYKKSFNLSQKLTSRRSCSRRTEDPLHVHRHIQMEIVPVRGHASRYSSDMRDLFSFAAGGQTIEQGREKRSHGAMCTTNFDHLSTPSNLSFAKRVRACLPSCLSSPPPPPP